MKKFTLFFLIAAYISSTCNAAADNLQSLIPKQKEAVTPRHSEQRREELICQIIGASRRPASYPEGDPKKLTEAEKKALEQQENSLKLLQKGLATELFAPVSINETQSGCKTCLVMNYKDNPNFCKDCYAGSCALAATSSVWIGGSLLICPLFWAQFFPISDSVLFPLTAIGTSGIIGAAACSIPRCCYYNPCCCDPDFYMLRYLSNPTTWDMTEETSDEKTALLSARDALEN